LKYDLIIFDLDGTLIDSKIDLVNSVNFTRKQLNLNPLPDEIIFSYIGDGVQKLIQRAVSEARNKSVFSRALNIFLSHYRDHLLDYTMVYPGVLEVLTKLDHKVLGVLTNKPLESTLAILTGLNIKERFCFIYAGNSFRQKKPHPVGINKILNETKIPRHRTLMVGDSYIDMETGQNARVSTCGVTYGLTGNTLSSCKPQFLIDDIKKLIPIVLG
tara:strand:- start:311 stop:955 length:645 start_codon:yes stop_codon:yes gene_type:complete